MTNNSSENPQNMQVRLAKRPQGWVQETDFEIAYTDIPQPQDNQLLVKNHWLSLDPYMRGRMDASKSYAAHVELGDVMVGGTVGEVVESHHPDFKVGTMVVGALGWQQYALTDGRGLSRINTERLPASVYLGAAGMPGITAWYGLLKIGQPKTGETVVVSAAAGAVGSVVGQIAKIKGCRAVGIAGGTEKCQYVVNELGFDACLDYKSPDFYKELKAATPDGVDVYFDNVGAEITDAVLSRLNAFARVPLCGTISQYNAVAGETKGIKNYRFLLISRVLLQGFIVSEHMELWPTAMKELGGWLAEGSIKYRETVAQGLENAPRAFIGLLKGENLGKQLVKLV